MPEIPELVRFHFARQSSSPWNWYTKPDFQGCALKWSAPKGNVALYIVFRSSESLPSDCCDDLLNGQYDDVVERIDIFKPITRLVDDEIHDKNRYLVLARLDNDDIVWIEDVESFQFSGAAPGENWTYWSNPYGDTPKIKDPCRLDYATVRVETFCGLEWDYPAQYPDFVGYDLIVCDVPYSPHTGADTDIEAFRAVLAGKRGVTYSLERFVNAVVDNESFLNKFAYYALLVRLPESGRVQIPLRHTAVPFEKGHPFQYLKARPTWGEGRDRMMAAYARWKAQMDSGMIPSAEPAETEEVEDADSSAEKVDLEFFQHTPNLSYESYLKQPDMIGIQFRAKVAENSLIVGLRATHQIDGVQCAKLLRSALQDGIFEGEDCEAYAFKTQSDYIQLIDADCHNKSWYAFALYHEESDSFEELTHVKDTTVDYLGDGEGIIQWGNPNYTFENRVLHCFKFEEIQKKTHLSIEFGIIDEKGIESIELYRFDSKPNWTVHDLEDIHQFQLKGEPALGARYIIPQVSHGVVDDISRCDSTHYYAAVSVDKNGNRMPLTLYSLGNQEREDWVRLSVIAPNESSDIIENEALSYHEALSDMSYHSSESLWEKPSENSSEDQSESTEKVPRSRHSTRYNWESGLDIEDEPSESEEQTSSHSSYSYSYERVSKVSRYSWNEETEQSEKNELSSDNLSRSSSDSFGRVSDVNRERVSRGSRYSWDNEADNTEKSDPFSDNYRRSSSDSNHRVSRMNLERVPRGSRYSWDDDDKSEKSSDNYSRSSSDHFGRISSDNYSRTSNMSLERVPRGSRYSWDDDDNSEKSESSSGNFNRSSSQLNEHVSRESEYDWGDNGEDLIEVDDSDNGTESVLSSDQIIHSNRSNWDDAEADENRLNAKESANFNGKDCVRRHYLYDDEDESGADSDAKRSDIGHSSSSSRERVSRGSRFNWEDDEATNGKDSLSNSQTSGIRSSLSRERVSRVSRYSWDDDGEKTDDVLSNSRIPLSRSSLSGERVSRVSRFNWDDDGEDSLSSSRTSQSRPSISSERVSRVSRFNWDDDGEDLLSSSQHSNVRSSLSRERVSRVSRFNWDDDEDESLSSSQIPLSRSSLSGERVSRVSRFNWDDDDDNQQSQEAERLAHEEEERKAKEEAERLAREEEERKAKEEAERLAREEEERKAKEEAERLAREEEERKAREIGRAHV